MYGRILVPIDGSAGSSRGLDAAIDIARSTHGLLRLVHVLDDLSLPRRLADTDTWLDALRHGGQQILEAARTAAEARGIRADAVLYGDLTTPLCEAIATEARMWPAELIVLGSHGRRGGGRVMIGSDAERILRSSTIPVVLVPAPTKRTGDERISTRTKAVAPALLIGQKYRRQMDA
ncbi:universal stress protein [Variovorax sp. WS11]|uniref:universal stress protein n=1 Tax=Variovorax sp. WS11 TaxID=1105204 RepID=UPI000D0CF859|nr:universal stress protein [Variovorax sp. WS11]NDZ18410.1 universal stress protein [Variovorax sp. WS11]PSL81702.1 universal stress protein [Variovorax sp. WS11]